MTRPLVLAAAIAAVALGATAAVAQTEQQPRTTVAFTGGAASGTLETGADVGASVLVDLTSHLAIEGQGTYLDRGHGLDAFSATASLLVSLRHTREPIVPYAAAGGGLYRAVFDLDEPRFQGSTGFLHGDWSGMPMFYAQRLGTMMPSGTGRWGRRGFSDPALTFGGGVRVHVADHIMIRPDVRALVVFADGDTHSLATFVVNLGYRF